MNEIINYFLIGYFEALKDAKNINNKKYRIIISNELKSKLYDIGYINGYEDFYNYLKNNL